MNTNETLISNYETIMKARTYFTNSITEEIMPTLDGWGRNFASLVNTRDFQSNTNAFYRSIDENLMHEVVYVIHTLSLPERMNLSTKFQMDSMNSIDARYACALMHLCFANIALNSPVTNFSAIITSLSMKTIPGATHGVEASIMYHAFRAPENHLCDYSGTPIPEIRNDFNIVFNPATFNLTYFMEMCELLRHAIEATVWLTGNSVWTSNNARKVIKSVDDFKSKMLSMVR